MPNPPAKEDEWAFDPTGSLRYFNTKEIITDWVSGMNGSNANANIIRCGDSSRFYGKINGKAHCSLFHIAEKAESLQGTSLSDTCNTRDHQNHHRHVMINEWIDLLMIHDQRMKKLIKALNENLNIHLGGNPEQYVALWHQQGESVWVEFGIIMEKLEKANICNEKASTAFGEKEDVLVRSSVQKQIILFRRAKPSYKFDQSPNALPRTIITD
uniref:WWE domain-containing protein n=1 Tax=Elaeophora elaphi TaxID=1147741 RepID=A0A0R3RS78_9BILA